MECYVRKHGGRVLIGNTKVEIGIDSKTGTIVNLKNKKTNTEYIQEKRFSRNFVIIYPLANESEIDIIDFDIRGEIQTVNSITDKREDDGSIELKVSYDNMKTKRGILKLFVTYTIQIKPDSDETIWSINVINQDKYIVREIWFPIIGGIYKIGEDMVVLPFRGGQIIKDPINTLPPLEDETKMNRTDADGRGGFGWNLSKLKLRDQYPGSASMQWLDYCTQNEGLYLASYDKSLAFTGIQFEKMIELNDRACIESNKQALSMFFVKYPFIGIGEKWESPKFILALHTGDWHTGAVKYREWARSWISSCSIPKWLRNTNGYVLPIMKQQSGRITRDYRDLPDICSEAKNRIGINLLYVWGWNKGGIDTDFPHYVAWDEKALRDNIKKIHDLGGKIILPIGTRIINIRTEEYNKYGKDWSVKTMHNVEVREHWEHGIGICPIDYQYGEDFVAICPSIEGWHEELKTHALKIISDYGADGVELDQVSCEGRFLCFDSNHPHKTPALAYGPGYMKMFKTIKDAIKKVNPDAVLLEEGLTDAYSSEIDSHYYSRLSVEGAEVFRFTFPEVVIFAKPTINYYLLNYAFSLGMRFDFDWWYLDIFDILDRHPDFQTYVKQLNDTREFVKTYMKYGIFIDNIGIRSKDKNVVVRGFKADNGIAIVVWNQRSSNCWSTIYLDVKQIGLDTHGVFMVTDVKNRKYISNSIGSKTWSSKDLKKIPVGDIPGERVNVILVEKK